MGYEIENRQILCTAKKDYTKGKTANTTYNEVLEHGKEIRQGYIKDKTIYGKILKEFKIKLPTFKIDTFRFRKYGVNYFITIKGPKKLCKDEMEYKISRAKFLKYWPLTKGYRIHKKRLEKRIGGFIFELDAFTDRYLLIAECEVDKVGELKMVTKLGKDITNSSKWSNKNLSK